MISNFLLIISIISIFCAWNNFLLALLSIELSMIVLIFIFLIFSFIIDDLANQIFAIIILTIAAAETVVGLLLLINFINLKQTVQMEDL